MNFSILISKDYPNPIYVAYIYVKFQFSYIYLKLVMYWPIVLTQTTLSTHFQLFDFVKCSCNRLCPFCTTITSYFLTN